MIRVHQRLLFRFSRDFGFAAGFTLFLAGMHVDEAKVDSGNQWPFPFVLPVPGIFMVSGRQALGVLVLVEAEFSDHPQRRDGGVG